MRSFLFASLFPPLLDVRGRTQPSDNFFAAEAEIFSGPKAGQRVARSRARLRVNPADADFQKLSSLFSSENVIGVHVHLFTVSRELFRPGPY